MDTRRAILIVAMFAALLLVLTSPSSLAAPPVHQAAQPTAGRLVGQISLPYSTGAQTVYIEDISPDIGSTAENEAGHYASRFGMVNALAASGVQGASSPASAYMSVNGSDTVEHIAAVASNGHLITWYYSASNDWKAVDVTEKSNAQVAVEAPTTWTALDGTLLLENIAARDSGSHVWAFTWHAGADWEATNLTHEFNKYAFSPLTSWNAASGTATAQHIAFRTEDDDLALYWRLGEGTWSLVNVSTIAGKKIAGTPYGWNMESRSTIERIATTDSSQHLVLFEYSPGNNWTWTDVSAAASLWLVTGRVAAWDISGGQYIAARTPANHLIVFRNSVIDPGWSVTDLTALTGVSISADPTAWHTFPYLTRVDHIVAPDLWGHIHHFYLTAGAANWVEEDVTTKTGIAGPYALAGWGTGADWNVADRMAAPTGDGRMHVFTQLSFVDWTAIDVSSRSAGRVVYAASPFAGIWTSRDYGVNWSQNSQPQPVPTDTDVPGAIVSPKMLDVVVSPANADLAIAAADREDRTNAATGAGVYRTVDGGQSWERRLQFKCPNGIEAATQVLFAPDDPQRVYAVGDCAIGRSMDGGSNWQIITQTTTADEHFWHLAVSGKTGTADSAREIVACGDGRLWVSTDDGATWRDDDGAGARLPHGFCPKTGWGHNTAAHILALVPDQPSLIYMAIHADSNGPSYYQPKDKGEGADGTFCNTPIVLDTNTNSVYDSSDSKLRGFMPVTGTALAVDNKITYHDTNGNGSLDADEYIVYDVNGNGLYDVNQNGVDKDGEAILRDPRPPQALKPGDALVNDSRLKYANLGQPFGHRGCGEASLWLGDLTRVIQGTGDRLGTWSQMPGPPVYYGAGSNSGATLVYAHPMSQGYLVLFMDGDTVQVSVGQPTPTGWHRLDGNDASANHRAGSDHNHDYMHVDPQGLAISAKLSLSLKPVTDQSPPYNQNSELDTCAGRIWIANDGGVSATDDCGAVESRWQPVASGLHTLEMYNIAGVTSLDYHPSLYFGVADDDDFYSMNDGDTWNSARGTCGDCDVWGSDLYQVNRVLRLEPRSNGGNGVFGLFSSPANQKPDAGPSGQYQGVNYPDGVRPYAVSGLYFRGYRPVIQTLPGQSVLGDADYIAIQARGTNEHYVMRARDSLSSAGLAIYGAQIPPLASAPPQGRALWVQAAGGHDDPYFYVGDGLTVYRARGEPASWDQILPAGSAPGAWRFFANPYDPSMLYALVGTGVYSSTDYGATWQRDMNLETAASDNGAWNWVCPTNGSEYGCTINDMVFDPTHPNRRFAAGLAGVFFTADGAHWFRLLDTRALPSMPVGIWFDPISRPTDATLYVATFGRGLLRLHPIPSAPPDPLSPPTPPPPTPTPTPTPTPPGSGLELLDNGGFEQGWQHWTPSGNAAIETGFAHSGNASLLMGHTTNSEDEASQTVMVPCDTRSLFLSYDWYAQSKDTVPAMDTFEASVHGDSSGVTLQTLTEHDAQRSWTHEVFDISEYGCQQVTLTFHDSQNDEGVTSFYIDDVRLVTYNGKYYLNLPIVRKE